MIIELYVNSSDERKVDKVLSNKIEIDGNIRNTLPNTDLIIQIDFSNISNIQNYNYIKINEKYYYIRDFEYINNSIIQYTLHIDVLMTYKNEIRKLKCVIKRNSENYNVYFHDNEISQLSYKPVQTKLFSNSEVFQGNSFLLTTV